MRAYIWLGILILSVFVAVLFLSRNMGATPTSAHAAEEMSHTECDHDHGHAAHSGNEAEHSEHEEKGASGEQISMVHTNDTHAGHEHTAHEDEHAVDDRETHTQDPHAGHDHAAHGDEHTDNEDDPPADDPHAGHAHAEAKDGICPEHQVPEAEDALCLSEHIGELRPGAGMLVRLASDQVGARAGIRSVTPEEAQLSEALRVPARLTFARERLATLTPLASGTVHKVYVRPGTRVEKGDLLLEIATPEIARLHAGYNAAKAQHEHNSAALEREKNLHVRGISAQEEVQRARAAWSASRSEVEQYRSELRSFSLDAEHMNNSNLVPLRAPLAGVVTRLQTSAGEGVSPASSLLTLADPDILWLELSIPAAHAAKVVPHTLVQVSFDGVEGAPLETELFHVDPALDPQSRTLSALAQIPNPEGRLKAGMFAQATLLRSGSSAGVSLPADAVQHIDGQSYIFIQREPDLFELRRVTTTALQDGRVGISAGLDPAHSSTTRVVSARGFALKSEVLRARLGASCADH